MSTWTEQETDLLRDLWREGLSASQIGARIGKTRNAVLGRVHRLGIADRPKRSNAAATRSTPRRKVAPQRAPMPTSLRQSTERAPQDVLDEIASVYRCGAPVDHHDDDPDFIGPCFRLTVRTMPLFGACRWPIGDPEEAGFHFCGARAEPGRPYCEQHARIAYVPAKPRKPRNSDTAHQRASAA